MPEVRPILADPATVRAAIHAKVSEAVRRRFPIQGKRYRAELKALRVREADVPPERQTELRLSGGNAPDVLLADIDILDGGGRVAASLEEFTPPPPPFPRRYGRGVRACTWPRRTREAE